MNFPIDSRLQEAGHMIECHERISQFGSRRCKNNFLQGKRSLITLAVLAGIASASTMAIPQTPLPTGLDSPDQGVVCNLQRATCYDRYGPSIALTEGFLGHIAAKGLATSLVSSGTGNGRGIPFSPVDGVECVPETGPCQFDRLPHSPLTAALYGPMSRPAGQTVEMRMIMYGEWHWQRTSYSHGTETRPNQPEQYTLRFEPDGVLSAKVDCNAAGGTYRFDGNRISIKIINSTLMSCAPDSLEQVFQQNLAATAGYFMKDGLLFLDLNHNTGTMAFDRPAPTPSTGQ